MYNFVEYSVSNNVDKSDHYYDERKAGTMNYLGTLSPAASSVDSSDIKMHSPMSPSMYTNIGAMLDDSMTELIHIPYLKITEQPVEKFRFRYKSEMVGTHGSLNGLNSDKIRKNTYPTVQLQNFEGNAIIRCSLYQINRDEPHAHRLVVKAGSGEQDDPHDIGVSPERGYTAVFQGMGIIHTAKKHLLSELVKKKARLFGENLVRQNIFRKLTQMEEAEINRRAEIDSKNINLNTVRLKFEAFRLEGDALHPLCQPIYSHGINNLKSALTGELKIVRMDITTTSCVGGQEIFMLVEKVTKNNIKVRFFECDDDDNEIWTDYGKFSHIDVHHQYAIVFKAPPYRDLNIEKTVEVCIELVRPSDGCRSEARIFKYKPSERVGRKRPRYNESLSSGELPATINNDSFGSVSVSDSIINRDPDFLKKLEVDVNFIHSDEFNMLFDDVSSPYTDLMESNNTTDGSYTQRSSTQSYLDAETEDLAKKIVSRLTIYLKTSPKPEAIEHVVTEIFTNQVTNEGNNALHTSIVCEQFQHLQYILLLLSKMKHLNVIDFKNNNGETGLHMAIKIKNATVVKLLLPVGADPNATDNKGNTALHLAINNDLQLDELEELVHGTNLDTENDDGFTPLHLAVAKGDLDNVKMLIKANANVLYKHRSNGNTVMHMAVEAGFGKIVRYLLESSDARLDDENYNKATPVSLARVLAAHGDESACHVLQIITDYIKEKGFDSLLIKNEPEDDDDSSESEALTIKSEPQSPASVDAEDTVNLLALKNETFEEECIYRLSQILDKTPILLRLIDDLEFSSIVTSMQKTNTKMLLNYANVIGVSVYDVRGYLTKYKATNAVQIIDSIYLRRK